MSSSFKMLQFVNCYQFFMEFCYCLFEKRETFAIFAASNREENEASYQIHQNAGRR